MLENIMRNFIIIFLVFFSGLSMASDVKIIKVKTEITLAQKYNITVTLKHDDKGWEHYANAWRIYSPDGKLIDERVLHHPHVKEQPFTRTLRGVSIPSTLSEVTIVAVCSKTGESDNSYTLKLR